MEKVFVSPAVTKTFVPVSLRMNEWVLSDMLLSLARVTRVTLTGTPAFSSKWLGLQPPIVICRRTFPLAGC